MAPDRADCPIDACEAATGGALELAASIRLIGSGCFNSGGSCHFRAPELVRTGWSDGPNGALRGEATSARVVPVCWYRPTVVGEPAGAESGFVEDWFGSLGHEAERASETRLPRIPDRDRAIRREDSGERCRDAALSHGSALRIS